MNVLGASVREDTVTFAVWAPRCRSVDVAIEGRRPQPMTRGADDVFTLTVANIAPGTRYKYRRDVRSEEHTSELQSRGHLVCRLLLENKKEPPFGPAPRGGWVW